MSKLVDLQKKRGDLAASMRGLVDLVDAKTGMTDDQESQWSKMNIDLDILDKQIAAEQKILDLEASLAVVDEPAPRPGPEDNNGPVNPLASTIYLGSFDQYVRSQDAMSGPDIRAALTIGTDTDGGYTVPEVWLTKLIALLTDAVFMRQLGTVFTTSSLTNIPLVADSGVAGWLAEEAAYPESDIQFGNLTIGAYKLGRIIKISEELLQDSFVDIVSEISQIFAMTFGGAEEAAFVNGDGTGKPRGVLLDAELGKTAASNAAITYDEIIDLVYSVREVYRKGASFLAKGTTAAMLRKLKSTDGVPLWQPSIQAGQPDMLTGYSFRTSEYMPAVATTAKAIAFGQFKHYRIGDRGGIVMQRLNEKYADTGHVGFRMRKRTDGRLLVTEAVKTLTMAV